MDRYGSKFTNFQLKWSISIRIVPFLQIGPGLLGWGSTLRELKVPSGNTQDCSDRHNHVFTFFSQDFGQISVRDVFNWTRVAETPKLQVFCVRSIFDGQFRVQAEKKTYIQARPGIRARWCKLSSAGARNNSATSKTNLERRGNGRTKTWLLPNEMSELTCNNPTQAEIQTTTVYPKTLPFWRFVCEF